MGKPTGFIEIHRKKQTTRPVAERLKDWNEVYLPYPQEELQKQGARCMDCGIPFCNQGCPLGNLIPDWNDLVYRNRWSGDRASARDQYFPSLPAACAPLRARVPACSASTTIRSPSSRSKSHRREGFEKDGLRRAAAGAHRARRSPWWFGPAGLAAAEQLNEAGHLVTVFEKSDRIGGLLRYGIPEFKMEKTRSDRRLTSWSRKA